MPTPKKRVSPSQWSRAEIQKDVQEAIRIFRDQRLNEPLDLYVKSFNRFSEIFADLIDQLPGIASDPINAELIADYLTDKDAQTAFRYLTAPPISEDDLETLADASLAPSRLRVHPDQAERVRDIVLTIIDPHRFPWVNESRLPAKSERHTAVVASAVLAAASEVGAYRRNTAKAEQEQAVKDILTSAKFTEVPARQIPMLTAAPNPGEFCGESRLAGTRADIVIRLHDQRVMPIECKVSNSAVNSYKRLIHEACGKAKTWYDNLGVAQVIPAAVLSGVFSPGNCELAQDEKRVALFWQHRLNDLAAFVRRAK